jgi:acyl carrier protein
MKEKVFDALRNAMENEELTISGEHELSDYAEWDSLAQLTLIAELDEKFGVSIEGDEFEKLRTVDDLVKVVVARSG